MATDKHAGLGNALGHHTVSTSGTLTLSNPTPQAVPEERPNPTLYITKARNGWIISQHLSSDYQGSTYDWLLSECHVFNELEDALNWMTLHYADMLPSKDR